MTLNINIPQYCCTRLNLSPSQVFALEVQQNILSSSSQSFRCLFCSPDLELYRLNWVVRLQRHWHYNQWKNFIWELKACWDYWGEIILMIDHYWHLCMGRFQPLSGRRAEESDLELSVITSQNSHYGGSDRSIGHIRENISLQKLFHNNLMVKIFGWRSSVGYQETWSSR